MIDAIGGKVHPGRGRLRGLKGLVAEGDSDCLNPEVHHLSLRDASCRWWTKGLFG